MTRGRLIVIEGSECAGTTTQTRLLTAALNRRGVTAIGEREPSGGPVGRFIRDRLSGKQEPFREAYGGDREAEKLTLALLFSADRLDHCRRVLHGVLERHQAVVCDRYSLSTYAYQLSEDNLDWLLSVNDRAAKPDITLFLDVPVEVSLERLEGRRDRELFDNRGDLEEIRANYLRVIPILRRRGERIEIVPGTGPVEDVTERLLGETLPLFQLA